MILNEKDYNRLVAAIKQLRMSSSNTINIKGLSEGIKDAQIIPSGNTPNDLITMNSKVLLKRMDNNQDLEISIVYHNAADAKAKKVSVFAPMGMALLGKKEQQVVSCELPNGLTSYKVCKLLYQPEAAGDMHL